MRTLIAFGMAVVLGATSSFIAGAQSSTNRPPRTQAATLSLASLAEAGDATFLRKALAEGAEANRTNAAGLTPVLALLRGRSAPLNAAQRQCLALLIEKGADLAVTDADGRTPLIHAARAGDLEAVRMITEAGVYVRTRDKSYRTALLHAAALGYRDVVVYLASNGDIQSPTIRERRERGRR